MVPGCKGAAMTALPVTSQLLAEIHRTLTALDAYVERCGSGDTAVTREHAAAMRATLDLSRALSDWRATLVPSGGVK